jgi:pyruvate/2-oxoglutarate dehydrogenase complex dihydrolipoamide dehydrogenase (E3) component
VSRPGPPRPLSAQDAAIAAEYRRLVFPAGHRNPQPAKRYNLVVIGAGPAGLVTSMAAASLGARVALVEHHAMGGDCLNFGCVPSKTLLAAAAAGLPFAAAMERVRSVRARIARHDSVERFTQAGVDVYLGPASFEAAHLIRVGEALLHTRRTVIATGARPDIPPIAGLEATAPLTNESVFELSEPPRRLAILGAGAAGCELAQAFARLGTRVDLIEIAPQVLPQEEPEAARLVAGALVREGVALHLASEVQSVCAEREGILLATAGGVRIVVDRVLVAAGRRRNIEGLGLEKAGVRVGARGAVEVDHRLRTTHPDIYAAGDVCSQHQFTHVADAHARIVVRNALFHGRARADRLVLPRCVYTKPEIAHVGATAHQLEESGLPYERYRVDWAELDRGVTDDAADGYAELLTPRSSARILGATLVGRDAGEQLAPILLLMAGGRGLESIGSLVLPYPTRSEYLRRLADARARKRLTPRVARVLAWWLRRAR